MAGAIKGLFGGSSRGEKQLEKFRPIGFRSGGSSGTFDERSNTFTVRGTEERRGALRNLVSGFRGRAEEFRGLRDQVTPGFGRLTRERVEAIRNAGQRTVGNLREDLSRRRVAGSSFASREIASVEQSFAQQEELARAESFLGELDLTRQLISDEFDATIGGAQVLVDQFNLDSTLAANLSNAASAQVNANLAAQAEIAQANDEAGGGLLGFVTGLIF